MSEVQIRPPRKDDAPALAEIHLENCRYYVELDPDAFQVPSEDGLVEWFVSFLDQRDNSDALNLVAEVDGEVAGMIEARIDSPVESAERQLTRELQETRLFVDFIGVRRHHWRSGVGTVLMKAAEDWGRSRGATIAALDTYVDSPYRSPSTRSGSATTAHSINFRKRL